MTGPNVSQVTEKFQAIPPEKKKSKVLSTAVGIAFAALGVYLVVVAVRLADKSGDIPMTMLIIGLVLAVFGGVVASGEIVLHPIKLLIAQYRDYVLAKKGERSE
jgi:dipeptide/tripeptide permease